MSVLTEPFTSQETGGGEGEVRKGEEEGREKGRRRGRGVLDFEAQNTHTQSELQCSHQGCLQVCRPKTPRGPLERTKNAQILT